MQWLCCTAFYWTTLSLRFSLGHPMLTSPKRLLHLEGLIVLAAAMVAYRVLGDSWLKFVLLFLAPDVFMAGYFFDAKTGAAVYNLGHTYTAPFLLWLALYCAHASSFFFICVIWAAHIGFDRFLGYGLKYTTVFKDTHLGKV
jgi:hypothetical protein